jgi:hypothetical protein
VETTFVAIPSGKYGISTTNGFLAILIFHSLASPA